MPDTADYAARLEVPADDEEFWTHVVATGTRQDATIWGEDERPEPRGRSLREFEGLETLKSYRIQYVHRRAAKPADRDEPTTQ